MNEEQLNNQLTQLWQRLVAVENDLKAADNDFAGISHALDTIEKRLEVLEAVH